MQHAIFRLTYQLRNHFWLNAHYGVNEDSFGSSSGLFVQLQHLMPSCTMKPKLNETKIVPKNDH